MQLKRFDEIQLSGVYSQNPITHQRLDFLQYFVVTDDVDGEFIPHNKVHPPLEVDVAMSRIVRINGWPVKDQAINADVS